MNTTINNNFKVTANWESVRDLTGSFYDEATFEKGDSASFIYLLPEVPRVLHNYYHTGTIEGWQHIIFNHIIWTCGSDPNEWLKMSANEFMHKFKYLDDGFEAIFDLASFAINSMLESDYYRAMSYIKSSVEDPELAKIFRKALTKAKTDKVKIDASFWKIFG